MVWLIDNLVTAADLFGTVASVDPLSAVLLACGALLVAFSSLFFGALVAGGLVDPLLPESIGEPARREQS